MHRFRHSFARHVLANGVPINVVSRWLGHGRLEQTLVIFGAAARPDAGHERYRKCLLDLTGTQITFLPASARSVS